MASRSSSKSLRHSVKRSLYLAPSILSADFGKINEEIAAVEGYSDYIHVDVMDGHFVPNITFGPGQIASMRSKKPFDVHLMIERPDLYLEDFAHSVKAAVGPKQYSKSFLVVHAEACVHLHRVIQEIHRLGLRAGVAINPATPLELIEAVLDDVDLVVCMTVNPGFGGQKFISSVMRKVQKLRSMYPKLLIEIDGGVNEETAKKCVAAGANVLVAGSYVFGAKDKRHALLSLRSASI